jgi:hypothetical protein
VASWAFCFTYTLQVGLTGGRIPILYDSSFFGWRFISGGLLFFSLLPEKWIVTNPAFLVYYFPPLTSSLGKVV